MNDFFRNAQGEPVLLLGLQSGNSSSQSHEHIMACIRAVKQYGGNVLEVPVYWNFVEPEMDAYCMDMVQNLLDWVRPSGLYLILLWFGANKNGHPNYAPDYIKKDPQTYQIVVGHDGMQRPTLSPHCKATLERDRKAYCEVLKYLAEADVQHTVIAVQIENEVGLSGTDRDYSVLAQQDYLKPLPEELHSVSLPDCGETNGKDTWRGKFGRHAHEAFSAWYSARYIQEMAGAGKKICALPVYTNVMLGEQGYEEAGTCYNAGGAVSRVLDIWKKAAPDLDLICPDIYLGGKDVYMRVLKAYAREDNALYIPETMPAGEAAALNMFRAFEMGCTGLCGFGAENTLKDDGTLTDEARSVAISYRAVRNLAPLLIRLRGTGRVHALLEEEFTDKAYVRLEYFHVEASFVRHMDRVPASHFNTRLPEYAYHARERGRALLVEVSPYEYYMAGAGTGINFILRPGPGDEDAFALLVQRQSTQLNHLSVEEGHFDGKGEWHTDFYRNGDQSNFQVYLNDGEVVRLRLNPAMCARIV